jgi:all-trans-retinol 13,14-reductase
MLLTSANSKSDEWADSLILLAYMTYDEVKKWENTTVEKRGQEYLDFKKAKAETLINLVEQRFPHLKNCIETYYTSTPLTYRDYTATREGSLYGIERDCRDPLKSYVPSKTKVPNLYFTGQNINLHGAIGVAIGSMLTCGEFVGLNNLIKKIGDAT